ncbi:hypothetical protein HN51_019996 [Arachis hypogaea]|uniref:telomerase reverse transcriptase isoform X1 n=1 Tax=Arachis hypogaea TaxID=3818 RepID=UPI000DEC9227|nr:telomerase reverse transcriptase [Arachis hypogaea]QHO31849.1 Telomerase reverse transcriptase [Arachis hypogaea]
MSRKRRPTVPGVLWRMFRNQARTLCDTIISLLPPPLASPDLCRCNGRRCLGCAADAMSFLLRPDDPSDYRKLLTKCFVVVAGNAPSVPCFYHCSPVTCPQNEIVCKVIEEMLCRRQTAKTNVLCVAYDRRKRSSHIVELLSCASWCCLLGRVGHDLMIYLLNNTSIFLPAPRGKHYQVGGPPINEKCFEMLKCSSKSGYQHPSVHKCGANKRKRSESDDVGNLTCKQQKSHISYSTDGLSGLASSLGLTSVESSTLMINHHESINDNNVSDVPRPKRTATVITKSESEGKQGLGSCTPRLGKRSRAFRWQRHRSKKQKQSTTDENSLLINRNMHTTNNDCARASFQCDNTSPSFHEKLQMTWQCSCCSLLQSLQAVQKAIDIKRHPIFYNIESSPSVLPKKHILYSLWPNLTSSKSLIGDVFGFVDASTSTRPIPCSHSSGSCLIGSACLYHSLVKWFKHLIRRTQCCQHTKLLAKHCVDNIEAIDSQCEAVKSYCSKSQVVSFIWAVSRSLVPYELLGSPSNQRIMRRNISKFINLRRFEKFPLKLCMHGLKTSRFPFLSNEYFLNSQNACFRTDVEGHHKVFHEEFRKWSNAIHDIKCKLLEKWIFWYYSFLVVPLVQANFYVTESEQGKNDVFYYCKPVWNKLTNRTINCFKDSGYSSLDNVAVQNILRGRPFGFSKLRLQPKENGVRMVANLKGSSRMPLHMPTSASGAQYTRREGTLTQQKTRSERYQSVNFALRDAHTILKGIQFKDPLKLGSSVFDYNDVYKKLCTFLVGQKKGLTHMPNLFIITSDVSKAFDSVDQEKLLGIMKDILVEDEYFLKQYDQIVCTKKSLWVQKQFTMLETFKAGHTQFTSFQSQHSVFVNQERRKHVRKKLLFSYLTEHVKHNVLQFDGKFFLQGVGIPQGGVLSTLLCSFYYGHLEQHVIFPFLRRALESGSCKDNDAANTNSGDKVSSPCYLLMRFIDDFLFLSTSKKLAASFLSRMQRGFRAYNCYMNVRKFGANFDVEQMSGSLLNRIYVGKDGATSFIRWSGLLINSSTMEIQADYTRYLNNHLSSTLTVCWQGNPGINLKEKLYLFLRPKCHPIFFDSNINSDAVVRLNIYQVFVLCAMKFHCYIRDLTFICKLPKKYCLDIIWRSLRYMYLLIKKRMRSMRLGSGIRPILKLKKEEVQWLGLHAYVKVLKRKESRHKALLASLRSRSLSSPEISRCVTPDLIYAVNAKNNTLLWRIKY